MESYEMKQRLTSILIHVILLVFIMLLTVILQKLEKKLVYHN